MRSLPENSVTQRSGSGCRASEMAARRRPAAQPSVRWWSSCQASVGKHDPARVQELARLLEREPQIARADLDQRPGEPHPVQAQAGVLARRQHHAQLRRQLGEEQLEQPQRLRRAQLVQIVDQQHDRPVQRPEVGQQPLDDRLAAERRRRSDALDGAIGAGQRVDDRQPEALRIALAAFHGDRGDAIGDPRGLDPGPQEDGLAAPGGRTHEHHLARAGRRQPVEQRPPRDEPAHGASGDGDCGRQPLHGPLRALSARPTRPPYRPATREARRSLPATRRACEGGGSAAFRRARRPDGATRSARARPPAGSGTARAHPDPRPRRRCRHAPASPRAARTPARSTPAPGRPTAPRRVEHEDPESRGVEPRPRARHRRRLERVRVVRHQHDGRMAVRFAAVVDDLHRGRRRLRGDHRVRGREQGAELRLAVGRLLHGVPVEPERDVVEEQAAVHQAYVDAPFDPVGERAERAYDIAPVDPEVLREVVPRAGWRKLLLIFKEKVLSILLI